jgi:hypothetical protein
MLSHVIFFKVDDRYNFEKCNSSAYNVTGRSLAVWFREQRHDLKDGHLKNQN